MPNPLPFGSLTRQVSVPFDVGTLAGVVITNYSAVFDGLAKPVTVETVPGGLSTFVTYNGLPLTPNSVGAYLVRATVTEPGICRRRECSADYRVHSVGGRAWRRALPFPRRTQLRWRRVRQRSPAFHERLLRTAGRPVAL